MRHFFFFILFASLLMATAASCDKADLPNDEEEKKEKPQEPTTDPTTPDTTSQTPRAYTVAEAQNLFSQYASDTVVSVAGYIVGASGPFNLGYAEFSAPFDVASNILLADRTGERDVTKLFPVSLPNGSDMRAQLNLADHPEWLGTAIVVEGPLSEYFRVAGMKNVYNWSHIEIDTPTDSTHEQKQNTPTLDHEAQLILGGRSVHR